MRKDHHVGSFPQFVSFVAVNAINGPASNLNTSIQRLLIDAIVVAENEINGAKLNNVDPVKGGTLPSFFIYNQRVE